MEEINRKAEEQPGLVAPATVWRQRQVEMRKEKREEIQKAKEKCTKDFTNLPEKSRDALEATATVVGQLATKKHCAG